MATGGNASRGIDVSSEMSSPNWSCLKALGKREYIVAGVELPNERRQFGDGCGEGFKMDVHVNNPQTATHTVTQSNVNRAQATSHSEAYNEFNFTMHLSALQSGLGELREEVEEPAPETAKGIEGLDKKAEFFYFGIYNSKLSSKMETYIPRYFQAPPQSFFLFGPRGTGKSTFLQRHYPDALWIDLLKPDVFRDYIAQPERIIELVRGNPEKKLVIVDEVQKVPDILSAVHSLIEENSEERSC